jgi:hypothetical protein
MFSDSSSYLSYFENQVKTEQVVEKHPYTVILNEVKDLKYPKQQDSSLRSE